MKKSSRSGRSTVGLVVEGDTEFHAFMAVQKSQPRWPAFKVSQVHGIGGEVSPRGIAERVAPKVVAHVQRGLRRVIVCIDRERRGECPGSLASAVLVPLSKSIRSTPEILLHIVVADRSFESWILADARGLHERRLLLRAPKFTSFEGRMGEAEALGKRELGSLLGRPYDETTHAPRLFAGMDFSVARRGRQGQSGSKSLDKLLRTIGV